jgi:hypothetical protein
MMLLSRMSLVAAAGYLALGCATGPKPTSAPPVADRTTFYEVPLVCGAAPHIGCGSKAKPVLRDLERQAELRGAWLNRRGTVVAVEWSHLLGSGERAIVLARVFAPAGIEVREVPSSAEREAFLRSIGQHGEWLSAADVDRLSEEEAEIIAARLLHRIAKRVSLAPGKSDALKTEFSAALKRRFLGRDATGGQDVKLTIEELHNTLRSVARAHLDGAGMQALDEALSLGLRPTPEERSEAPAPCHPGVGAAKRI